jgi:hypothetical protein
MRINEVKTVGEFISYCERYETSMDNYEFKHESMEIQLMEMALNVHDGKFFESGTDRENLTNKLDEKTKAFLKKALAWLIQFLEKAIKSLSVHMAKMQSNEIHAIIEKNFTVNGQVRTADITAFNSQLQFFYIDQNADIYAKKQHIEYMAKVFGFPNAQIKQNIRRELTALTLNKLGGPDDFKSRLSNVQSEY